LHKVLEEKVLDSHVDLTLRKLLWIAKEFHDTIVDLIKRKRQQSDEEEAKKSAITMVRFDKEEEDEGDSGQPLLSTSLGQCDNRDADEDRGEERDRSRLDRPLFGDQPHVD
jgi:hypothetical protein